MALAAEHFASSRADDRRRAVEARLALAGAPPAVRRAPPPEGRLGADEYRIRLLLSALVDLGPVFAGFGRYLSSRIDLLRRRDSLELSAIPDRSAPMAPAEVDALIERQLGTDRERRFFEFDHTAFDVTLWTQRHRAWLAPGVPVLVTLVRPDVADWLKSDLPLLSLLGPWFDLTPEAMAAAIDDFASSLRRRLDQKHLVSALATLAADSSAHGGFSAPLCYRDHCAPGILTIEKPVGVTLQDVLTDGPDGEVDWAAGEQHARRLVSAWLRSAILGRVVPFDFRAHDIVVDGDRLVLIGGAFETHPANERMRFLNYINAVAADDPDRAAAWFLDANSPEGHREEGLRRRLRQAVPFRDGEWSGDDRLAEFLLVQWRMTHESDWPISSHHLHLYRGLLATAAMAGQLAPREDVLQNVLLDERLRMSVAEARRLLDPAGLESMLDRTLLGAGYLPQKLDAVLELAAEGRLHVKLNVPDSEDTRATRDRTTLLVAMLVALASLAAVARQVAPAFGIDVERLAAVVVLVLGGWLLVAAARM